MQRVFRDDGVGVEEEDIASRSLSQCLIVGASEPHVLIVRDKMERRVAVGRKAGSQIADGMVGRMVIYYEDLNIEPAVPGRRPHAFQALPKVVSDVV